MSATSSTTVSPAAQVDLLGAAHRSAELALAQGDWALNQDPTFARSALNELAAAVRAVTEGSATSLPRAPWTAVARPLIDMLRRQLLSCAEAAGDSEAYAECHRLLMALERVNDQLRGDDLFVVADQLGGARALDLLVEVAHDMRSPLGSILFLVDRVRSGQSGAITAPAARQLGLVYSAAFGLSALSSDLMELSRGSGRLMGSEPIPFSLSEIFRRVQDMLGPVAEEKGLTLQMERTPQAARVGYPAALLRVLLNLTTNACKFTSHGEVRVCAVELPEHAVRFEVHDTGRGVPPEVMARLYQTFHPRTGSGAGAGGQAFSSAGLGLAICRKLVSAMGGTLSLETSDQGGSSFAFTIALPHAGGR